MKRLLQAGIAGLFIGLVLSVAGAADRWGAVPLDNVSGLVTPAQSFVAVTPSDTLAIASGVSRAIYSHDGGNVVCVDRLGTALPFLFSAGEIKPLRCVRVNNTSTTSTTIYALY